MGDMVLELPLKLKGIDLFPTSFRKIYIQMQRRHLRPCKQYSDSSWRKLGRIDVAPKVGIVECGLTPLTTDMREIYPFQTESAFICRGGQK